MKWILSLCIFALSLLHADPREYYTFNYPSPTPGGNTLLTGIRGTTKNPNIVYISGFYTCQGETCTTAFVYKGNLSGKGKFHILSFPSSKRKTVTATNLYGPNNGPKSDIQVVGNYTTKQTGSSTLGCLYEGPLDGSGKWTTLIPTSSKPVLNTIAHSTMGGLVVGNYNIEVKQSKAFIYDIATQRYFKIIKPGSKSITAYGIWHNGGNSYTICGGYSNRGPITGYLVDWNNKSHKLTNWRSYSFKNDPAKAVVTHFDGITSDGHGGYYLTGDWSGFKNGPQLGFFSHITAKKATWSHVTVPHHLITSGNSVYKKVVIGVYTDALDQTINGFISFP